MFGAGGGTSSYREVEESDVILLWGSNARETHPIFFHHVLKAVRRGAKLFVVDPRKTSSSAWADEHLQNDVGTDIELAHAMAREILAARLENRRFIERATTGFEAFQASVEPFPLDRAESLTRVPGEQIRRVAHAYAKADRAMICWTLGITEHHNAVDNVLSLINLALLTGHVGRYASGLNPLRGQNNVQGGGDMGALPNKLTGFQDVEDPVARSRFEAAWGVAIQPKRGKNLTEMMHAMESGELTALLCVGENPAHSEADSGKTQAALAKLDCLIVADLVMTRTAELAQVVFPASASWCESEGTVTNSERRVQRVRKVLEAPGEAKDDLFILAELARRLGRPITPDIHPSPVQVWNEVRSLSPLHTGMSYPRLEALRGIQWPCPDENHPGESFLHGRLWEEPVRGPKAPFSVVAPDAPADPLDADFPIRLTTGRRLESFNTGVMSGGYEAPRRRGEALELSPADAAKYDVREGDRVRIRSRRGSVVAAVRLDPGLRQGLAFMTFHFPDEVDVNQLTIDAADPRSGTAEFKAAAIAIERVE